MIDPEVIARDLKRAHADFGSPDLFSSQGDRIEGFFMLQTDAGEVDAPSEDIRIFRSPQRLEVASTITDRKQNLVWRVSRVWGEEGAFYHQLKKA